MRLKHCLDQGMSKAEMARRFGVSERTIRSWVAAGQLGGDLTTGRVAYSAWPPRRLPPRHPAGRPHSSRPSTLMCSEW